MLRRNGKPRSCEPCRISKIKCDHATPTCQKCQTRGVAEQCFYHPNPMTKPAGTPRKKPEPRRRKADGRPVDTRSSRGHGRLTSLTLSPPTLRDDIGTVPVPNSWPTPPESATRTTQTGSDPARSFYLGSTSYAAVFTEERPLPDTVHEQPSERVNVTRSASSRSMGSRHCQIGAAYTIVSTLTPFVFFEKSLNMYFENQKASAFIGPLILSALPRLRLDLAQLVAAGNDAHPLYAEMIKNTARPLKVPSTMLPSEFHTLFTGRNLRWETLGLVLAIAVSNAQFTSPHDPLFTLDDGRKLEKDDFIEDIINATNECINICQTHGAVNDIMVWLVYANMMVISNFYGDNYHGTWRRMGDSVSALYATGMHCEGEFSGGATGEPLFLREARRRLYSAVYRSDKTLAVFFGRPPMMNWRYSDRRQLLDISDRAVASDDPSFLNAELSKIGSTGWNVEGQLHPASFLRLRCQIAVFKERLLEQSLAGEKDSDLVGNLQAISTECIQWWATLPRHLRYETYTEEDAWIGLGAGLTLHLITTYLDYLHLHFQTQRLLHRQTQQALPALLEVSLNLLSTTLVSTKPNNRVYETRRHFPTVTLFYCFPAAGVLALELRRCTIEGVPLPDTISRADVIRTLSVLTSCLEWIIVPGDGNHKLCSELNKMLTLVLDEVLNYEPPTNGVQENGEEVTGSGQGFFNMPMIDGLDPIPTEAADFLNWLDDATWNSTDLF
ncbi:uncharacterized protein K460DRAFT_406038 [Cucurbitaria berberidis CBS 394.84]|uniref:Zn(2)-C6 fungal-type domain-containing protein n=1 Tax=Cucurbitaria berberidis CBS 394.84 TaxID=1168544 RepID=A0A9P4GHY6_9PLEO|nr:uncharacterized protein K460DRAFT_406038 [Cucurbitaria berberidis CBS 394.84]KAF1845804.1 hypothetical protein K460DRAFT_406038 [Cucurbitaria berberidis CBS 394.84]